MPGRTDAMSIADAAITLLLLAEWTPPLGLTVTVTSSCRADRPGGRVVTVVLSAVENQFCVINVGGIPNAESLNALSKAARLVLEASWDQPAFLGLGPALDRGETSVYVPAELITPGGPLDLRSYSHPIYDTTRFGRDK